MIPLYRDNGQLLTTLTRSELPLQSVDEAKKFVIQGCIVSFEDAALVSNKDTLIKEAEDLPNVKFAVMLKNVGEEIDVAPITFYVRRTDKKGMKLTLSPFTTVHDINVLIEQRMQIPPLSQELYFNSVRLEEPTDTLRLLQVTNQRIIHIVDRRFIFVDLDAPFKVYLQGAQHKSETVPLEVRGKMTLLELKHRAAEKIGIPPEATIIAYCSQVLEDNDQNLFALSLTENAIVKVLDERTAYIEHFSQKEEEDTFIKRQNKALAHFPPREPKLSPREDIRMANSVVWQEGNNISILNSEAPEKSYMESFRINESVSYEETYNRALKATYNKKPDSPSKLAEHFPLTARSVPEIAENAEENSTITTTENLGEHISEFQLMIHDILGTGQNYELLVTEIDTVKDLKNKFSLEHSELVEGNDILLNGKVLEDDQVIRELGITAGTQLTLMPRS